MTTPIIIAPSILAADFGRLTDAIGKVVVAGADWIHLDVMDGHFVPNISFGVPVIAAIRGATQVPFDCHLMIAEPEKHLAHFAKAGVDHITIHAEASTDLARAVGKIGDLGCKAGVAIKPETSLACLESIKTAIDIVLIMSVNPGFGGQKFMPAVLDKIRKARQMCDASTRIAVDGGITTDTAKLALAAGADTLIAGTSIFAAPDHQWAARIGDLREA